MTRDRAQGRRPVRRRRARRTPRARARPRCCTAAARSATSAPAPSTPRRSPASPRPSSSRSSASRSTPPGSPRCATTWSPASATSCPTPSTTATRLGAGTGCPATRTSSFPGCEGDSLLMLLDARGIECSTGSACSAGVPQASHVLLAMGRDEDAGARLAAVLARPHLDRRPTSTRWSRRSARSSSAPARPASPRAAAEVGR